MDRIEYHKKVMEHLKNVIKKMRIRGLTENIDIIWILLLIDTIAKKVSATGERRRAMKREIFKLLIIMNAKYWHSTKSDKYHKYVSCQEGNNIEPEYIDIDTLKEYRQKRYKICGSCKEIENELRKQRK